MIYSIGAVHTDDEGRLASSGGLAESDAGDLLFGLTHHCEIFEMNSESFRFRESMKEQKKSRKQI